MNQNELKDLDVLRGLAETVASAAQERNQQEKIRLWVKAANLSPERPMVLANPQNGWAELVPDISLICQDSFYRNLEYRLRQLIFRIHHIPDDYPILNIFEIGLSINYGNFGFEEKRSESGVKGGAYHIEPVIKNRDDAAKLSPPVCSIDWNTSKEAYEKAKHAIGGIMEVRQQGCSYVRCGLTRKLIHLRGLEQMLYDLYDDPDMMHFLMQFLMEQQLRELDFLEKNNALFTNTGPNVFCGSGGLAVISENFIDRPAVTAEMFAWGESQEFSSISCQMYEEFVLRYQLPILSKFGLVDYGCCEALDNKYDVLMKKIKNLRWIAVSPWAERAIAAEKIQNNYVYVYKPNPSIICRPIPDYTGAEEEIRQTMEIAKGCTMYFVMKDTSTFFNDPYVIGKWAENAKKVVCS